MAAWDLVTRLFQRVGFIEKLSIVLFHIPGEDQSVKLELSGTFVLCLSVANDIKPKK